MLSQSNDFNLLYDHFNDKECHILVYSLRVFTNKRDYVREINNWECEIS